MPIPASSTAKVVNDVLSLSGIGVSEWTCRRLLHEVKAAANLGAHEEQFRKLADYFAREKQSDPQTTTDLQLDGQQLKRCFIAWGASRSIINIVKPIVTVDGSHLSPEGTGQVRIYPFLRQLLPCSVAHTHICPLPTLLTLAIHSLHSSFLVNHTFPSPRHSLSSFNIARHPFSSLLVPRRSLASLLFIRC